MTDNYGYPTTRTFPRRMEDAFKKDPQNAEWFFPPEKKRGLANALLFALGIILWACVVYLLVVTK